MTILWEDEILAYKRGYKITTNSWTDKILANKRGTSS